MKIPSAEHRAADAMAGAIETHAVVWPRDFAAIWRKDVRCG